MVNEKGELRRQASAYWLPMAAMDIQFSRSWEAVGLSQRNRDKYIPAGKAPPYGHPAMAVDAGQWLPVEVHL